MGGDGRGRTLYNYEFEFWNARSRGYIVIEQNESPQNMRGLGREVRLYRPNKHSLVSGSAS
jgi:hypothetical protein